MNARTRAAEAAQISDLSHMIIESPVGSLTLAGSEEFLTHLMFGALSLGEARETPLLREAARQLAEYFSGARRAFSLPLQPAGTPFQLSVWQALQGIPYGETRTYLDIARAIGREKATRAVGGANHNNPLSIFIPCHRVIGANGSLTGYGGGLAAKEFLLALERGAQERL